MIRWISAALLVLSLPVTAAPLDFDEINYVDPFDPLLPPGDFTPSGLITAPLDIGQNKVRGSMDTFSGTSQPGSAPVDFIDAWTTPNLPLVDIDSVTLVISNFQNYVPGLWAPTNAPAENTIAIWGDGDNIDKGLAITGNGTYSGWQLGLDDLAYHFVIVTNDYVTFDYEWTVTVPDADPNPVPAPASIVLLLGGLLVMLRRRFA